VGVDENREVELAFANTQRRSVAARAASFREEAQGVENGVPDHVAQRAAETPPSDSA
jgi:hypothetical protein